MNYLVIVAHPDDEVLGAGATINKLIKQGHKVSVAILSTNVEARANISDTLRKDEEEVMEILGVTKTYHADFPNIKMNTIPHLEIVNFIEKCIEDSQAEAIISHHPADVNIDHHETGKAVNAACRLFQRKEGVPRLKMLLYMEILSSTEWNLNSADNRFMPNYFSEIGKDGLELKLKALSAYKGIMRPYPHPRSMEAITGLAAFRGAQAGLVYAEAFECVFRAE